MNTKEYLEYVVKEIHTVIVATVDDDGLPVTSAIDMMDADEGGLYFLTAKGKGFYDRLKKREFLALTATKGDDTMNIERDSFSFGAAEKKEEGYFITEDCIGCGSCLNACPQNCIESGSIPHVIEQEHCLHCGNCMNVCPAGAVVRRLYESELR